MTEATVVLRVEIEQADGDVSIHEVRRSDRFGGNPAFEGQEVRRVIGIAVADIDEHLRPDPVLAPGSPWLAR